MGKLKQLFCAHQYKKIAKCVDWAYCEDHITFSDIGMHDLIKWQCKKCGKLKYTHEMNNSHPFYSEWEPIKED